MEHFGAGVVTVVVSIIGLAMVAVALSTRAQTPKVIQSAGTALSQVIGAAVAPVAGGSNFGATSFGTAPSIGGLLG